MTTRCNTGIDTARLTDAYRRGPLAGIKQLTRTCRDRQKRIALSCHSGAIPGFVRRIQPFRNFTKPNPGTLQRPQSYARKRRNELSAQPSPFPRSSCGHQFRSMQSSCSVRSSPIVRAAFAIVPLAPNS
jgi:hypothetical protein